MLQRIAKAMDAACPENLNDMPQAPARLPHYGGFVGFDGSFFGDSEGVESAFYFSKDYIERKLLRPLEWHPDWEHKASLLKWLKTRNHEDLTNEVRYRIHTFITSKTREGLGFAYCKVCDKKYSAEELTFHEDVRWGSSFFNEIHCPAEHCLFFDFKFHAWKPSLRRRS